MSRRESIVVDVIDTLKNAEGPRFALVTRDPFDPAQLSRQQFPALYISTADETREDITQSGSAGRRQGKLEITIVGYVNGTNLDTARNDLIERVEEVLDADRTRGGIAFSTQLTKVKVNYNTVEPYSEVELTVEIDYTYVRGAS